MLILLAMIFFAGTVSVYQQESEKGKTGQRTENIIPDFQVTYAISQLDFHIANNHSGDLRVVDSVNGSAVRLLTNTFLLRLIHTEQQTFLKIASYGKFLHFRLTELQYNGFYLYQLCKLLN
jgi:hypothetical protein